MPSFKEKVLKSYPDAICVEIKVELYAIHYKSYIIHSKSIEYYILLGFISPSEEEAWESAFLEIEAENELAAEDEEYDDDWPEEDPEEEDEE